MSVTQRSQTLNSFGHNASQYEMGPLVSMASLAMTLQYAHPYLPLAAGKLAALVYSIFYTIEHSGKFYVPHTIVPSHSGC